MLLTCSLEKPLISLRLLSGEHKRVKGREAVPQPPGERLQELQALN